MSIGFDSNAVTVLNLMALRLKPLVQLKNKTGLYACFGNERSEIPETLREN